MFGVIVGVQFVKNGCFVFVLGKEIYNEDKIKGQKCEKVYVKNDSYQYDKVDVGVECFVDYKKVDDKYYTNIKI